MVDVTPFLPGLPPVQGKAVIARFDGGQLSSEGGLLVLREIEGRLGVADRWPPGDTATVDLANCGRDRVPSREDWSIRSTPWSWRTIAAMQNSTSGSSKRSRSLRRKCGSCSGIRCRRFWGNGHGC